MMTARDSDGCRLDPKTRAMARRLKEMALKKAFGKRLREIRESRALSQLDLADLLKTDVMQVSRYERGIGLPSLETCAQLAHALRVSTDELILGASRKDNNELPISDVRLLDRFAKLQGLDKKDRDAVLILVDGVLARRSMEEALASTRRRPLRTNVAPLGATGLPGRRA